MRDVEFEGLLADMVDAIQPDGAESWSLRVQEVSLLAYCSVAKDRMRIMAPVAFVADLSVEELANVLAVNFNADARYALAGDMLHVVYLHGLSTLTETDLRVGLRQVVSLVQAATHGFTREAMRFEYPRPPDDAGGVRRKTIEAVQKTVRKK